MGADIHGFIEYKAKTGGCWQYDDQIVDRSYAEKVVANGVAKYAGSCIGGRNYHVFGLMAGVRAGYIVDSMRRGFLNGLRIAKYISHYNNEKIPLVIGHLGKPKGIPHDLSCHLAKVYSSEGDFVHNMSYHGLHELEFLVTLMQDYDNYLNSKIRSEGEEPEDSLFNCGNILGTTICRMKALEKEGYTTRLVYWFDS